MHIDGRLGRRGGRIKRRTGGLGDDGIASGISICLLLHAKAAGHKRSEWPHIRCCFDLLAGALHAPSVSGSSRYQTLAANAYNYTRHTHAVLMIPAAWVPPSYIGSECLGLPWCRRVPTAEQVRAAYAPTDQSAGVAAEGSSAGAPPRRLQPRQPAPLHRMHLSRLRCDSERTPPRPATCAACLRCWGSRQYADVKLPKLGNYLGLFALLQGALHCRCARSKGSARQGH